MDFVVKPHKGQKDATILDGFEDILALLEDSNVNMLTAMSSRCWHFLVTLSMDAVQLHATSATNNHGETGKDD